MSKFTRLFDYVAAEGLIAPDARNLHRPHTQSVGSLSVCHDETYLHALKTNTVAPSRWRRVGLPWSAALIERTFTAPQGTLLAAQLALEEGIACHLAGGTHHAHFDFGSGYCMVNDLAYAARRLVANHQAERVLIFDCDVHQGDGTAAILSDDTQVFTCSIHCEKNFPFRKQSSDCDIGLPLHMGDREYLDTVYEALDVLLTRVQPDLVLYDAGVDVWQHDSLGKLNISWDGIRQRDESVIRMCAERSVPVATVIGGGYDMDHARLARRHGIVVHAAHNVLQELDDH